MQVIEVPQVLLADFFKMPESNHVAVYFLFGETDDGSDPKVYIGQTGDLQKRLTSHSKEKDFWQRALVLISRTSSLTQTHSLFLEWYCLQATRKAGRYADENGNGGSKPHTPAPLEADCLEIFETGQTLLATLGYPIFDPVRKPDLATDSDETFYCTVSSADGRGFYTPDGFVVAKGSSGRKANAPSLADTSHARFRAKIFESGAVRFEGDRVVFVKDYLFRSPSMAALALIGATNNGWMVWKNKSGRTLDEVKRQSLNS